MNVFVQLCDTDTFCMSTMSTGLHPAIAVSASVTLVVSYFYVGHWISSMSDEGIYDVPTVLASLLEAEKAAVPRHGTTVAVAFGGCRDRLASSVDVMHQLSAVCPDSVSNIKELHNVTDLEETFAYYFMNGASARSVCCFVFTLFSLIFLFFDFQSRNALQTNE